MSKRVLIGASTGPGLAGLEAFVALRLGNCVLADLPLDMDEAAAMCRFCREHEITLFLSELVWRGSTDLWRPAKVRLPRAECPSREQINAVLAEAGEYYGGRMTIGEAGGVLYWPKDYLFREAGAFRALPPCEGMLQAREAYLDYMREFIAFERREVSDGPLMNVDSSLVFRYHAEAGIDILCHEALPGDPHRMQAALRGAARAYGKPWGTHIAMGWYGGVTVDELWLKRWKTSVYYSYLTGSEFIYPESGHLALTDHQTGARHEARSSEMLAARRTLREAVQFSLIHDRPEGGPKVTLGLVSGYGDGAPGLWNPWAWGQFHDDKWLAGPPEWGWELVDDLHRRTDWPTYTVQGERDWSGQPPYGQYDIVPIEADLECLQRYTCLVFPGWHTMTEEIYAKLRAYVEGGGHLLMWLPQLRGDDVRGGEPQLFRDGDFRDLFGVRVTGRQPTGVRGVKFIAPSSLESDRLPAMTPGCDPRFLGNFSPAKVELTTARVLAGHDILFGGKVEEVAARPLLVENRLGDGVAMLVTAWEYPADPALLPLTKELLRVVSAGEQGEVRLLGSDRVRWAVYELGDDAQVIYLLNTDPDCAAPVRLWVQERLTPEFTVPANEMVVAYRFGPVVVQFPDKLVNVESHGWEGDTLDLVLAVFRTQRPMLTNLDDTPVTIVLNGMQYALATGESARVLLPRCDVPGGPAFAPDFADEPDFTGEIDSRTAY